MKNFKRFTIIIVLLGVACYAQASGRTAKLSGPLIKKAMNLGTATNIAPHLTAYTEGSQSHFEQSQTSLNNYTPLPTIKGYEQSRQFKNNKTQTVSSPTINMNDAMLFKNNRLQLDTTQLNNNQSPTIDMQGENTQQNLTMPSDNAINAQTKNFNPSLVYQKPVGTNFGFKGMPRFQEKAIQPIQSNQLLLTYDPTYKTADSQASENLRQTKALDITQNDTHISQKDQVEEPITTPISPASDHTITNHDYRNFKAPQEQIKQQAFDINQMYINDKVNELSQTIDSWNHEYADSTSNMYVQENLKEDILNSLFIKNEQKALQSTDLVSDAKIIDDLLKKYKDHQDVQPVLNNISIEIKRQMASQKVTPKQANTAIARYYTPAMRDNIFSLFKKQPIFDAIGNIKNMPSIELIIKTATENPTAESLQALQTSLEAVNVAIYASRADHSILGDGNLLAQIKLFEKEINNALENQNFKQFQSWGSYLGEAASDAGSTAFHATVGKIPVRTALNASKQVIDQASPYVNTAINLSGVKKMTLYQGAKTTGLIPTKTKAPELNATALPKELTSFQQTIKNTNEKNETEQKRSTNAVIAQYHTPAMINDIFMITKTKPMVNPATGEIENMPSVESILEQAQNNPTQETFNALQAMLEATKVAIYANRNESSLLNVRSISSQLKSYQSQINNMLESPEFKQFHSWTTQATSYLASFLPSLETVLNTTGLGDMTIESAINHINTAGYLGQAALAVTGLDSYVDATKAFGKAAVNASGLLDMNISQAMQTVKNPTSILQSKQR